MLHVPFHIPTHTLGLLAVRCVFAVRDSMHLWFQHSELLLFRILSALLRTVCHLVKRADHEWFERNWDSIDALQALFWSGRRPSFTDYTPKAIRPPSDLPTTTFSSTASTASTASPSASKTNTPQNTTSPNTISRAAILRNDRAVIDAAIAAAVQPEFEIGIPTAAEPLPPALPRRRTKRSPANMIEPQAPRPVRRPVPGFAMATAFEATPQSILNSCSRASITARDPTETGVSDSMAGLEPCVLEPCVLEPCILEPCVLEPCIAEPLMREQHAADASYEEPCGVGVEAGADISSLSWPQSLGNMLAHLYSPSSAASGVDYSDSVSMPSLSSLTSGYAGQNFMNDNQAADDPVDNEPANDSTLPVLPPRRHRAVPGEPVQLPEAILRYCDVYASAADDCH